MWGRGEAGELQEVEMESGGPDRLGLGSEGRVKADTQHSGLESWWTGTAGRCLSPKLGMEEKQV